jgi:uncharacterized membrane protein YesL
MAGFFGLFDFTKEGPGVYEDEPERGPIPTFFGIVGRKFWKLCSINLMYILFSLPALILAFFGAMYFAQILFPGFSLDNFITMLENSGVIALKEGVSVEAFAYGQLTLIYAVVGLLLVSLSLIVVGPVHAGIVYVLRNYAREEHSFIWSDFKEHALKNWKQSLVTSLISLAVTAIFVVNLAFYNNETVFTNSSVRTVARTLVVLLLAIWCMMQMYLYPMMVTFDLKLKDLYRNSLLFAMLRLPFNFLFLIISILLMGVLPFVLFFTASGITIMIGLVYYVLVGFAFNLLMTVFFAYRGLDRFMIKRFAEQQEKPDDADAIEPTESDSSDSKPKE